MPNLMSNNTDNTNNTNNINNNTNNDINFTSNINNTNNFNNTCCTSMSNPNDKKLNVGGQAVLEGVMMRTRRFWSIAVRKPDNTISSSVFKEVSITNKKKVLGWPFIRGIVMLVENLSLGFKALSYSVNEATDQEVNISKKQMGISITIALIFVVGIFFVLPTIIGRSFSGFIGNTILFNLIEGLIRIAFLICYIVLVSFLKDIKRLFQYHGAEHKTIQAYENGEEIKFENIENIKKYSRLHLRCGTSFLLIVMVVSLFVFALLGKPPLYLRIISRILLIPIIAGISYELIRLAGKFSKYKIVNIIFYPGLLLQKITTREPDDDQIEVAVISLNKVLEAESAGAQDEVELEIIESKDEVAVNA